MKLRDYNSISQYDKTNNLIKYVEFTDDFEYIKCSYVVSGNKVERKYLQDFRSDDEPYIEILNSIVEYNDNVILFPLRLGGETYLETRLSGHTYSSGVPTIVNTFFSSQPLQENHASVESFSINSNLIDDYLNKL
jgi:hypothetical protein